MENYVAYTIHFINNFELKSHVLCCSEHDDEATAIKMERQLYNAITEWGLNIKDVIALVTNSASNMNSLGEKIVSQTTICHNYCADHILQLSAIKAFSGNASTMEAIKKLKTLVTFVNKSPLTSTKFLKCQKMINPISRTLKLLADVKTHWWSTYAMVERCLKLRPALERLFREKAMNRVSPD